MTTTPMMLSNFGADAELTTGLRVFFSQQLVLNDPLLSLFNVQDSARAVERTLGLGEFGDVPEYHGALSYDGVGPLFKAEYVHREYAKGFAVERRLVDDQDYALMGNMASSLGLAFDRTVSKAAADVFNSAFARLGPDGKALCVADHPLRPGATVTGSNRGTLALTADNLRAARQAMMRQVDSRGNPMMIVPDVLVVPVELVDVARALVESQYAPGGNSNDINTNLGYRVMTSAFLTDVNNWFLVDSRLSRRSLQWFWRVRPQFAQDPSSDYNLALRFWGYMRFSVGYDDWRWVYGHEVTG